MKKTIRKIFARFGHFAAPKGDDISEIIAPKIPQLQSRIAYFLIIVAFLALFARLAYLMLGFNTDFLQRQGEMRFQRTLDVPAMRGRILDRNGYVLASSVPAKAIWAIPRDVKINEKQLKELSKILDVPIADLRKKLSNKRSFVYVKRQVPMQKADAVAALKIPGIHYSREYIRNYPDGEIAAQITGLTGIDGNGVEGIELAEEKRLSGKTGSRRVLKDRLGRIIEDAWIKQPKDGDDITLSIDARIQFIAYSALEKRIKEVNAKAGAVIVADPATGEILALANYPSFNPNVRSKIDRAAIRNRAITDTYEPGSTMKPFSVGASLEEKLVTPDTVIPIGRYLTIGRASIGDSHFSKELTVHEVIQHSSNIGTAKVAMLMEPQTMWNYYDALGFGKSPDIGFPGAVSGRMRAAKNWKPIEQATISYGHGITVSLLQLVRAYTALARTGDVIDLSIYKGNENAGVARVYSKKTTEQMQQMLESVVEKGARRAQADGYSAAGKTGTAYKVEDGLYVKKYVASFTGYAPAYEPKIVVGVMIDEPEKGKHFGAVAAAPVFSEVVSRTLRLMAVDPDKVPEATRGGVKKPAASRTPVRAENNR